jgi:hypothetical protein
MRRVVTLYDNVEDLITENDRRYEEDGSTQELVCLLALNHSFTQGFCYAARIASSWDMSP